MLCMSFPQLTVKEEKPYHGWEFVRVLQNKSRKMTPSKCAKNREKNNYLILLLIRCVEICTFPSLNAITHLFHLWKFATNWKVKYWWVLPLTWWGWVYPETARREKEGMHESNRKFEAAEKSLWIPLIDTAIMSAFSDEILLPWKTLLKIPCLLFSNINLLKIPLML